MSDVRAHFDTIAEHYKEEIPAHIREHLNAKEWALVSSYVSPGARALAAAQSRRALCGRSEEARRQA